MSVADVQGGQNEETVQKEVQRTSETETEAYMIGEPSRTPVCDAEAELNASLDISGSTESDVADQSIYSIVESDHVTDAELKRPRERRSDDSPESVDMTAISQPSKRPRMDSEFEEDSNSSTSSSSDGHSNKSTTSSSGEGTDDDDDGDGTDEGADDPTLNTEIDCTSHNFNVTNVETEIITAGDPASPEEVDMSMTENEPLPETPASPTDDYEEGDLTELCPENFNRSANEPDYQLKQIQSQEIQLREDEEYEDGVVEVEEEVEEVEEEEEVEESVTEIEQEPGDEHQHPSMSKMQARTLSSRDPRLMLQPPSPLPQTETHEIQQDDDIESISSTSDTISSGEEEEEEDDEDSISHETITATETTDAESDMPLPHIEITQNPEKIYYIRRNDGTVHAGHVLQSRTTENSATPNEYYVHYVGLNRRLDGWVGRHRISDNPDDLGGLTVPPQKSDSQDDPQQASMERRRLYTQKDYYLSAYQNQRYDYSDRKMTRYQKRRYDEINHVQKSYAELSASQAALEKEHESITMIKYIDILHFGKYEMETWYFSPFPGEYMKARTLYVCEYCLKYMRLKKTYSYHLSQCQRRGPPGREIYRKDTISINEIDGKEEPLYCQLLCLMAKLFLDHKVLFFDMDPFLFYVLCEIDKEGRHIVGYFSKEKKSLENNNVACILVLPPHQRKGYGKLLIAFSYELSRREGMIGSPEHPLSDLGRLSYRSYWAYTLLELMKESRFSTQSIQTLSEMSGITRENIIFTLQSMKMIKYWKGQHVICVTAKTINDNLQLPQFSRPKLTIDLDCLDWQPHNTANTSL